MGSGPALLEAGEGAAGAERDTATGPTTIDYACLCPHDGTKVQTTHHILGDAHTRMLRVEKKK